MNQLPWISINIVIMSSKELARKLLNENDATDIFLHTASFCIEVKLSDHKSNIWYTDAPSEMFYIH